LRQEFTDKYLLRIELKNRKCIKLNELEEFGKIIGDFVDCKVTIRSD